MRFFTLKGYAKNKILIDPDGNQFDPFDKFKKKLSNDRSICPGSLNDYLGHTARFIDYIYAVSQIGLEPTKQNLEVLIDSYESYLLEAQNSSNQIAQNAAILTGRKKGCAPSSLIVIEAALKQFLTLSDSIARANGEDGLFSRFLPNTLTKIDSSEASALRCGSMLGGVIRSGAKHKHKTGRLFNATKRISNSNYYTKSTESTFEFPLDRICDLIKSSTTYRDKCNYSFLAASGVRNSESLQLRPEDIDVKNGEVFIINPFERPNPGLRADEYELLKWKGRNTPETFMIEPYATMFFDNLRQYFRHEYIPNQGHPFIFQTLKGINRGRPQFSGNRNSRINKFRKTAKNIGVNFIKDRIIHSLRHSYGIYMLNYLPTPTGIGMPIAILANIMGHASIDSTKVYARHDKEIIRAELEYANKIILGNTDQTKRDLLIRYYAQKIKDLQTND